MRREFTTRPVLLGASGRVGLRIARAWRAAGQDFVAVSSREGMADLHWDMDTAPPPMPQMAGQSVFVLSGAVPGPGADLARNVALAEAGAAAARTNGAARCFLVSSSAVYGPTGADAVPENAALAGASPYARAKIAMERAVAGPTITALRVSNVAGISEPFLSIEAGGEPALDRFADGRGPSRSYVGPGALARILAGLAAAVEAGRDIPPVLNVAGPEPVAMADIFAAAGREVVWRNAPEGAAQHVHLDTSALAALVAVEPQDAAALWADARATGGAA
ncbi:NAD-dependent epimerase/dehydratase family protein [Palleronia aestuarii]|uniref:NAD-dependent epimerase/dehydratase family protein n=1 Tax=Palleronia aestuarii TaxID=568105 RepID=A0A2W7ND24_9RHOB|nr:NAD-dependent epimerase/dehydratase family protein [Palleronia aestuarii]PZX18275.1 NAD-dependent epimerase/dehydratase family protein [Palleronia aestuarii]